mgnify:CR=1 FL=1
MRLLKSWLQKSLFPSFAPNRKGLQGRTPMQRTYIRNILSHDVSFGIGPAGTGKTYLAVAAAVSAFEKGEVERIVLTVRRLKREKS